MPFNPVKFKKEAHEYLGSDNLHHLTAPHIESFNSLMHVQKDLDMDNELPHYMLPQSKVLVKDSLLKRAISDIGKQAVQDANGNMFEYEITDFSWDAPRVPLKLVKATEKRVFPSECRQRKTTYKGAFKITLKSSINEEDLELMTVDLGHVPIMTRSSLCHLNGMTTEELVRHHEDMNEMGGTFIVNGNEKLIRLLIQTKRNHPFALVRSSFHTRGKLYSDKAIMIRSVRPDQTSLTNYLHYLTNGSCNLRFHYLKAEYLIPVALVLKALTGDSDLTIFKSIISNIEDSFTSSQVEQLLRDLSQFTANTKDDYLSVLGQRFRTVMNASVNLSDIEAGSLFLNKCVLPHLGTDAFNLLILMIRKLYALTSGQCIPDDMDATQNHEVLLGGHLYLAIIKEQMEQLLITIKLIIAKQVRTNNITFNPSLLAQIINKKSLLNLGSKLEYFLATGNLISKSGLDQLAMSGYTIIAEKLNFHRYLAHFRCIHRGTIFMDSKSTSMRKLKPESFGFLCCVHTPDGAPCGLLIHLTHCCRIINFEVESRGVLDAINLFNPSPKPLINTNPIMVEGKLIGWSDDQTLFKLSQYLRLLATSPTTTIPNSIEIGYIPSTTYGQYPGLFIFTGMARMTRPTRYLSSATPSTSVITNWIGPFEQVYLNILLVPDTDIQHYTTNNKLILQPTHVEFSPINMLSVIANLTPYSDYNQSPRNMYQCQMGKQTMGTPSLNKNERTDNKSYLLNCGQAPLVRSGMYDNYKLDDYPNGTNAVVAVISYTSYDMEDAMIINKMAHERGIGSSTVYKSDYIDLLDHVNKGDIQNYGFGGSATSGLDSDGLPAINTKIKNGSPMCSYINHMTMESKTILYKGMEDAIIDQIRLIGDDLGNKQCTKVCITYRINRPTITGDKWSSRHGQKGVNSLKYPMVDLPFTENGGIQPDIIINPNAFPSRMTIGMFVESMAGKLGSLDGTFKDGTPFQKRDGIDESFVDEFGQQLAKRGYNYYGNEQMYSGTTGELLEVDIYIGVVYYQRLRHMVSDKYQVRTTGPVDRLTKQPIKGRKRAGGIRFGEMERDSLLAHGTSFMLQDRLLNCSDYTECHYCRTCGTFLNIWVDLGKMKCHNGCGNEDGLCMISMPYVLKYFTSELASMNIKMKFTVREANRVQ